MPSEKEESNPNLKDITKQNIKNFFKDERELKIHTSSKYNTATEVEPDYIETVSNIYREVLNISPDIGNLKYYANQLKFKIITEHRLRQILKEYEESKKLNPIINNTPTNISTNTLELVYCMIGTNRLDEIKPYIESTIPYVDRLVYVDSYSTDGSADYIKVLCKKYNTSDNTKIVLIQNDWNDRFSEFRNHYIEYLKSINFNGWTITSDTDEHFPEETLSQLRTLIKESENGTNYTGIRFQVEDILVDDDDINKIINRQLSNYWKPLMFKFHPDLYYTGEPHETLTGYRIKWLTTNYIYHHIRSQLHIYSNAVRNFFISNSNRWSERWQDFRFLCTKNNSLTFSEFWNIFEKHTLPKEIEDWIYNHKDDNFDSGDSEVREMAKLYFEILPERNKQKLEKINNSEKEENPSSTTKVLSDIIESKFAEGLGKEIHEKIPETIDALTSPKEVVKHNESKEDGKEEPIYEHLSIGECLIISKTKNNALVAANINGSITFTQVPIPDEDSNSYWKLTEEEQYTIRKMRFGVE